MEKLELRARARAAARAAGLFEIAERVRAEGRVERSRPASARRPRPAPPPPALRVDETQARAACAPMGELETVVQAQDAKGGVRLMYVVVPDMAMRLHYERLGFSIEDGCRVLLDAAAMVPIAVLRMTPRCGETPPSPASGGFNPYFDLPVA